MDFKSLNFIAKDYEAKSIDPKIYENDKEMIFFKPMGSDYILQPKAMLYRGSMCSSELYSNKTKVKYINSLIRKRLFDKLRRHRSNENFKIKVPITNLIIHKEHYIGEESHYAEDQKEWCFNQDKFSNLLNDWKSPNQMKVTSSYYQIRKTPGSIKSNQERFRSVDIDNKASRKSSSNLFDESPDLNQYRMKLIRNKSVRNIRNRSPHKVSHDKRSISSFSRAKSISKNLERAKIICQNQKLVRQSSNTANLVNESLLRRPKQKLKYVFHFKK